MLRVLIADLTFVENTLMDTFISDKEVWVSMRELSQEIRDERDVVQRLVYRVQRAKIFYDLMMEQFKPLFDEATKRGLGPIWLGNPLEEVRVDFERNTEKALTSAQRIYGK